MKQSKLIILCMGLSLTLGLSMLFLGGEAWTYDRYSVARDATNCRACHGDFNSGAAYQEMAPGGGTWPNDAMTTHSDLLLGGDCDTCHSGAGGGKFPVLTNLSKGGDGLETISCAGCHGRAGDGTGTGTVGYGAGLRQHHWRADDDHPTLNLKICANCHADANPDAATPVGEDVLPPYYANPGNGHTIPTDPCTASENVAGDSRGLDNDGDMRYEGMDPDCGGVTAGEPSNVTVTAHDVGLGTLDLSYTPGCSTIDNTIVYGPLDQVSSYAYSGEECFVGVGGTYSWSYPASPDSFFFLIVGDDGIAEGSYGRHSNTTERPHDAAIVVASCPLTQDITAPCP